MAKEKKPQTKTESSSMSRAKTATRGRVFEGFVIRKFPKRITIEFERTVFIQKYERFAKKKTRIHARLPDEMHDEINVGDYVKIQECRPLSKTIHHICIGKIRTTVHKNGGPHESN